MSGAPIVTCGADAQDRDTIEAVAEEFGREFHHADEPAAVEAYFAATGPALVLLSAHGGNGAAYDVCGQWKQAHPTVPVVFVGVDDAMDTKMDAVTAGADQFLVSPIDEEALRFVFRFLLVERGR